MRNRLKAFLPWGVKEKSTGRYSSLSAVLFSIRHYSACTSLAYGIHVRSSPVLSGQMDESSATDGIDETNECLSLPIRLKYHAFRLI